jgi:hypothetical protein
VQRDDAPLRELAGFAGDASSLYVDFLPDEVVSRTSHWWILVDGRGRYRAGYKATENPGGDILHLVSSSARRDPALRRRLAAHLAGVHRESSRARHHRPRPRRRHPSRDGGAHARRRRGAPDPIVLPRRRLRYGGRCRRTAGLPHRRYQRHGFETVVTVSSRGPLRCRVSSCERARVATNHVERLLLPPARHGRRERRRSRRSLHAEQERRRDDPAAWPRHGDAAGAPGTRERRGGWSRCPATHGPPV